jgi:hypothetical protein
MYLKCPQKSEKNVKKCHMIFWLRNEVLIIPLILQNSNIYIYIYNYLIKKLKNKT